MVAGAWTMYNRGKMKIGNNVINLSATTWKVALFTSASNAATNSLSLYTQLTGEVATGNGYTTGGKACTNETWLSVATGTYKFDFDDVSWSASGAGIANIKFAVVVTSAGNHLLCRSQLTTTQFSLAAGNTLTLAINTAGVITLT